jgi:hypothetical protein
MGNGAYSYAWPSDAHFMQNCVTPLMANMMNAHGRYWPVLISSLQNPLSLIFHLW